VLYAFPRWRVFWHRHAVKANVGYLGRQTRGQDSRRVSQAEATFFFFTSLLNTAPWTWTDGWWWRPPKGKYYIIFSYFWITRYINHLAHQERKHGILTAVRSSGQAGVLGLELPCMMVFCLLGKIKWTNQLSSWTCTKQTPSVTISLGLKWKSSAPAHCISLGD
jgi:hypothetical protein